MAENEFHGFYHLLQTEGISSVLNEREHDELVNMKKTVQGSHCFGPLKS